MMDFFWHAALGSLRAGRISFLSRTPNWWDGDFRLNPPLEEIYWDFGWWFSFFFPHHSTIFYVGWIYPRLLSQFSTCVDQPVFVSWYNAGSSIFVVAKHWSLCVSIYTYIYIYMCVYIRFICMLVLAGTFWGRFGVFKYFPGWCLAVAG